MTATSWTIRREVSRRPHRSQSRLTRVDELRAWLAQLRSEKDSNFYLTNNETGDELTVLMHDPVAAISFMRGSDRLPYSASKDPSFEAKSDADCHAFSVGETPTPVPNDRCVSLELMEKIVEHIFVHGSLPDWIAWRQP